MPLFRLLFILVGLAGAGWGLYEQRQRRRRLSAPLENDPQPAEDVPALLEHLRSADWRVRVAAVHTLSKLDDPSAAPRLLDMLDDVDSDVRDAAVNALVKLGCSTIPDLQEKLHSSSQDTRIAAAQALGRIGDSAPIADLIDLLQGDVSAWVRMAAAAALGDIGAVSAVPALIKAMIDPDGSVRKSAKDALVRIGTPEALKALAN